MYPPRFGNSSYMVTVPATEARQAVDSITRLLGALNYRGVFSAEFKQDPRDNLFKLLEVNARPWWFVEFAASCGVNVVEMAYRDALGLPVADAFDYEVGKRLSHPYYDWYACRSEYSGTLRATVVWLRSMAGAEQPVFKWSDPRPGVSEAARLVSGFLSRRLPWRKRK
jgi:predicted ATP-grasp superfamily ATP-dependent carboligase